MERKPLIRLLLVEASLELVPPSLWREPDVVKSAKRYGISPDKMLLDKSLHYNAMRRLNAKWKRGRPDIIHVTLLNVLDSLLAKKGLIEIYFHTIEDRLFYVRADTRIPKSYERFRGLMTQLLLEGKVPPESENPLIKELNISLEDLLDNEPRILLWEKGKQAKLGEFTSILLRNPGWLLVGAFPKGDFSSRILRLVPEDDRFSLAMGEPMMAWTIVSRILCSIELALGLI